MQHELHTIYRAGLEPTSSCIRTNAVQSTTGSTAPGLQSTLPPLRSPSPDWVVVFDEQGVPNLEPASQHR